MNHISTSQWGDDTDSMAMSQKSVSFKDAVSVRMLRHSEFICVSFKQDFINQRPTLCETEGEAWLLTSSPMDVDDRVLGMPDTLR